MNRIDHYENFPVATWLCPKRLRPAVRAVYHFARTADDLADEGPVSAPQRLADLGQYRADLQAGLRGTSLPSQRWPHVFGPLLQALKQHPLPTHALFDLLDAFEQDVRYTQAKQGYANRAELLSYCRRSANPIGSVMLALYGVHDASSHTQSDAICTALQLINFWQDRAQDLQRGRDYLPRGHTLRDELRFARDLMHQGAPLARRVKGLAGWELRAVVQAGLLVLDKLDARQENVDHTQLTRPILKKIDFMRVAWRCIFWPPR